MLNPKAFIQKVKVFISANPKRAKFIGLLILAAALPLIIVAALTVQNLQQKASQADVVQITDANGNVLQSTTDPNVFIKINLPSGWVLPDQQSSGINVFVNNAYAQEEESENICDQYTTKVSCIGNSSCGWGVIGGTEFCATAPANPNNCRASYDEWYYDDPNATGDLNTNKCVVSDPTPTKTPTPTSASESYATPPLLTSPTPTPDICNEWVTVGGCGQQNCPADSVPQIFGCPTGIKVQNRCLPSASCNAYATPHDPITLTPAPAPNILRFIYIENKDADGSTGGNAPLKITVNSSADIAHTAWRLNDLLPGQTQAPRIVQVTLIEDNQAIPFAFTVNLSRSSNPVSWTVVPTTVPPVNSTVKPIPNYKNNNLNNDSLINCRDVTILINQYGQKGTNLSADLNYDGIVDGIDYNILVRNYTPGDTTVCE